MKLTHLIPKALKQFLIEREAYKPCMTNVDVKMLRYYYPIKEESYQLNYLFDWDKSPEGFNYWAGLCREYTENIYATDPYSTQRT